MGVYVYTTPKYVCTFPISALVLVSKVMEKRGERDSDSYAFSAQNIPAKKSLSYMILPTFS